MTETAYRAWLQTMRSALTGDRGEYVEELGEWRCDAAHVRRAGKSGTGYKEPYAMIPLTHAEHDWQHRHGELAAIQRLRADLAEVIETPEEAKDYFDQLLKAYRKAWFRITGDPEVLEYMREVTEK